MLNPLWKNHFWNNPIYKNTIKLNRGPAILLFMLWAFSGQTICFQKRARKHFQTIFFFRGSLDGHSIFWVVNFLPKPLKKILICLSRNCSVFCWIFFFLSYWPGNLGETFLNNTILTHPKYFLYFDDFFSLSYCLETYVRPDNSADFC